MPEGPEVWILSEALKIHFGDNNIASKGKHLILHINNVYEDWSFGLSGKVNIDNCNNLSKIDSGWLNGEKKIIVMEELNNSIDFMVSDKNVLQDEINKWKTSKKQLAGLLLDQKYIAGIGVAWGSEILAIAGLLPNISANKQDLSHLAEIIVNLREQIKTTYMYALEQSKINGNIVNFINNWFDNLYEIRNMNVYKKGNSIKVLGRTWWLNK